MWYVVRLKANQEARSARELGNQGFVCLFPQFLQRRIVRHRVVFSACHLFPGYGFVEFDPDKDFWGPINHTPGVLNLITSASGRPLPLPSSFISRLQSEIGDDGYLHRIEEEAPWTRMKDKRIQVSDGPFETFSGLCEQADSERIWVLLSVFGQERRVELDYRSVIVA